MTALFRPGTLPISGEVQFWRMSPDEWEPALRAVVDVGITTVATYLSWRRHEPRRGEADLRGRHGPELDVHRFLRLCRDLHLEVILKPGPWICAEEPGGGFPDWLLADPALHALDHTGRTVMGYNPPFKHPVPSYASTAFRAEAERWLRTVWTDLAEFTGAEGPVVGTQFDNEPSLGFQDTMYGFDHHPDAIADWHRYVGSPLPPPEPRTDGQSGATVLERRWAEWQRTYIADYLAWVRQVTADSGAQVLAGTVNLNTHPVRGWPQDGTTLAAALPATVVGEDHYYVPPLDTGDLAGLALAVAQARLSRSPLVWAPEMQAGIWRSPGERVDYPDPTVEEQVAWWGSAIALGYQGFNLYMLVNRENWEHAPITRDGRITPLGDALRAMLRELHSVPDLSGFAPVAGAVLGWSDTARVDAYRVRGPQAAPETPWDEPRARAEYDYVERRALEAVSSGVQFDLGPDDAPTSEPSAPVPGHLVRHHRHADGRSVLHVVRLPWGPTADEVVVPARTGWQGLRRGAASVSAADGCFRIPRPVEGYTIWEVDRTQ